MMSMITADVFSRFFFNAPIRGVPLIIAMSIIAVVFFQLADTIRMRRLTRSDLLIGSLIEKRPKLGYSLEAIFNLVGVFVMAVLLWYSVPYLTKAWELGTYDGTAGEFTIPEWPVKAVIVIGSALCVIQFARNALNDLAFLTKRGSKDV